MIVPRIHWNVATGRWELFVFQEGPNGRQSAALPLVITMQTLPADEAALPMLTLDHHTGEQFFSGLAAELTRFQSFRKVESRMEGELEATKRHLHDLNELCRLAISSLEYAAVQPAGRRFNTDSV